MLKQVVRVKDYLELIFSLLALKKEFSNENKGLLLI
jgi:hypothetical protein